MCGRISSGRTRANEGDQKRSPWFAFRSPLIACLTVLAVGGAARPAPAQNIPAPESVLGFVPGTDYRLAEWPTLVRYYRALAESSDRVEYRELGRTTLDAPFVALVISSPANLARLDAFREINAQLADPRRIASAAARDRLLAEGRTVVLVTSSIHSTEVGTHLAPTIIAHRLASGDTPAIRKILDETIVLLVPSLNPDGITMVTRWYDGTRGTPAEGTGPPELYHHYVGHDNNRDWYAFTQVETQLTVDSLHNVWHPQIVHDIHQQGSRGSRFFLPPFLDPVEPNVDPLIVSGFNSLGTHVAWDLHGQGKLGVVVNATYDAWTPARAYQHYHAGVRILSETASASLASPITVEADELRGRRGFDAHAASWNFPAPWPGGRWTLADIVDYQSSGALALLGHAADNRDIWLRNFLAIGERAVAGWDDWPHAFVIPRDARRPAALATMLRILDRGGVEIREAEAPFRANGQEYPAGTYVVRLAQPYAAFAKAMLEVQEYPDLRLYPGGPPRPPYDVTAHTLPLLMGVEATAVRESLAVPLSDPIAVDDPSWEWTRPTGRVGLYRSHDAAMDEGWTRWIFDTWNIPYTSLVDSVVRSGDLRSRFDAIVLPRQSPDDLRTGRDDRYPAQYRGGLGQAGAAALRAFVVEGGTLVALDRAALWAAEEFDLPVRNVIDGFPNETFYAPGSIFRLELDATHPLSDGMPDETIAWFQNSPTFEITDPSRARAAARYPAAADHVLLSGWALGLEHVAGRAALVEAPVGEGRVILFGFRPQYRGQSIATYPLLFNALE